MKKWEKNSLKNIIRSPILKIIIGGLTCILIPVLINKLVLDNLFSVLGFNENLNRGIRVIITTLILMPLLYIFLFSKLENRKVTEFVFRNNSVSVSISFILSIIIIGISFMLMLWMGFINVSPGQFPKNIIVNVIIILGLVITEEIFFRGIFYRIIEDRWGTVIALASSALIFSLMHLENENASFMTFLSVITGGAVLGILYTYTKSLLVPIAFHFGWNLIQVFLGYGLSGGDEFSELYVFKLKLSGSDIITGGMSGIENSVIAVLILIIVFIVLYKKSYDSNKTILLKRER